MTGEERAADNQTRRVVASAGAATLQIGTRPLGGGGSQWLLASTSHQCDKREGERERPNIAAHPGQKRDLATAVGGSREAHSGPWLWAAHRRERERERERLTCRHSVKSALYYC